MRTLSVATLVALMTAALGSSASADDEIILWLPEPNPEPELAYQEFQLEELERKSKRSRNALIGTSVAAAVGLALVLPAASSQCESVEANGQSSYECTRTGDALIRAGSPLVIGGLTGAVVSGIILGVRKGKIRRLNDSFAASSSKKRAVQWDERKGRFVF
jgi:hypothetical protein